VTHEASRNLEKNPWIDSKIILIPIVIGVSGKANLETKLLRVAAVKQKNNLNQQTTCQTTGSSAGSIAESFLTKKVKLALIKR
jgi:hypothetical protein